MRRFVGKVGYAANVNRGAGIYVEEFTARVYMGDVIRNEVQVSNGEKINDDISTGTSISIVADGFALNHFKTIRYAEWAGETFKVEGVTLNHPRLVLRLGGVYNGPKAPVPVGP